MRRRVFWMFVLCLAILGCRPQRQEVAVAPSLERDAELEYNAVTASALVFDPPMIADEEPLELSRADRQPGAVVGYEGPTIEHFYIRFDDSQIKNGTGRFGGRGGGSYDRYERRAVTERIGVRYR